MEKDSKPKDINVLYISYDGMTDPLGQAQVIPYLLGLSKKGYKITILSAEKKENFLIRKDLISSILTKGSISWEKVFYTKKPPVISTIKDTIRLRKKAAELHFAHCYQIVHCRSYISALIGAYLKSRFSIGFIFDMRGFWADERVDGKIWDLRNPLYKWIYKYFKRREKEFLEQADYIVSLTENAKNEIHSWRNIENNPVKIQVIPCCVDTKTFDITSVKAEVTFELRKKLGIQPNNFVLLYLGSIGTWYMVEEMMDFFKKLKSKIADSKFLFVTQDPSEEIIELAKGKGIDVKDVLVKKAQREEIPTYLSIVDASIFFIKPAYSKKASSPTKQGELMSMGIPVICNSNVGDTDYVINKYNSGFIVKEFTDYEYDRIINNISRLVNLDSTKIRKGALEFFSLEKGVEMYDFIYTSTLDSLNEKRQTN